MLFKCYKGAGCYLRDLNHIAISGAKSYNKLH